MGIIKKSTLGELFKKLQGKTLSKIRAFLTLITNLPANLWDFLRLAFALTVKATSWSFLRDIRHNKIIRSAPIWFALIPIIAKLLSTIEPDKICFSPLSTDLCLSTQLPFNWQILFLSSIFFLVSNILVSVSIPDLVNSFKNYSDFQDAGMTLEKLEDYKRELPDSDVKRIDNIKKLVENQHTSDPGFENSALQAFFWNLYNFFNYKNLLIRLSIIILYIIGFYCFFNVVIQNIEWVLGTISQNPTRFISELWLTDGLKDHLKILIDNIFLKE
ncbi:MAG: hypothetical protein ABW088_05340 [Sedimenticola sp.]